MEAAALKIRKLQAEMRERKAQEEVFYNHLRSKYSKLMELPFYSDDTNAKIGFLQHAFNPKVFFNGQPPMTVKERRATLFYWYEEFIDVVGRIEVPEVYHLLPKEYRQRARRQSLNNSH